MTDFFMLDMLIGCLKFNIKIPETQLMPYDPDHKSKLTLINRE